MSFRLGQANSTVPQTGLEILIRLEAVDVGILTPKVNDFLALLLYCWCTSQVGETRSEKTESQAQKNDKLKARTGPFHWNPAWSICYVAVGQINMVVHFDPYLCGAWIEASARFLGRFICAYKRKLPQVATEREARWEIWQRVKTIKDTHSLPWWW